VSRKFTPFGVRQLAAALGESQRSSVMWLWHI
jgi:hypothetical protein